MTSYTAPTQEMTFVINELADLSSISALPGYEEATPDLVEAVLEEAGKLASEVLAPLNPVGDQQGSRLEGDGVKTPEGWKTAYQTFTEGGWNGLAFDPERGGQGLPWLVATAVQEMLQSSNMSFSLCPMLTQGAVEAIELHGTDEQKDKYLEKLISGEWAGTMNLTEPQAGTDLAAVRTKAVPNGDHYLISGQKIFITYGDQDLTENIIHTVLARTPDAPDGVKGISMFIVPKYLVKDDGNLGERNEVRAVSLEHKLGIHASPTAVLSYGDDKGAVGYLIGEENQGLKYMFTMMNLARHAVGLQGLSVSERAYQQALAYANERVQGQPVGYQGDGKPTIIQHPDVRRMLLTMKCQIDAMRALLYLSAGAMDKSLREPDSGKRQQSQALLDLLIPVVKGWSTEIGNDIAYTALQIHGGMGFIEETGIAQTYRDARITTIYEGTTGIQAGDLVGRKVLRDGGQAAIAVIGEIRETAEAAKAISDRLHNALSAGVDALETSTRWLLESAQSDPRFPAAAADSYLRLWGVVAGGWQMARAALIAQNKLQEDGVDKGFYESKMAMANYYAGQVLPQAQAYTEMIVNGSELVDDENLSGLLNLV